MSRESTTGLVILHGERDHRFAQALCKWLENDGVPCVPVNADRTEVAPRTESWLILTLVTGQFWPVAKGWLEKSGLLDVGEQKVHFWLLESLDDRQTPRLDLPRKDVREVFCFESFLNAYMGLVRQVGAKRYASESLKSPHASWRNFGLQWRQERQNLRRGGKLKDFVSSMTLAGLEVIWEQRVLALCVLLGFLLPLLLIDFEVVPCGGLATPVSDSFKLEEGQVKNLSGHFSFKLDEVTTVPESCSLELGVAKQRLVFPSTGSQVVEVEGRIYRIAFLGADRGQATFSIETRDSIWRCFGRGALSFFGRVVSRIPFIG